jgi:hypothetical protein
MTDEETNAEIEREIDAALAAEVEARRVRMRAEITLRLRREKERAHHEKINRRHPIMDPLAGLTQEQEDERQRQMAERTRLSNEKMDRANSRPIP